MLVDLGRNDVGRVATSGHGAASRTRDHRALQHVMHMVSPGARASSPGLDALDVLAPTFPAGTRQRRAEGPGDGDHRRAGARRGAGPTPAPSATSASSGDMDLAIAIRTLALERRRAPRPGRARASSRLGPGGGVRRRRANKARALMAVARRWRTRAALSADPRRRQLRLVHLQPRAVPRASSAPRWRSHRNDEIDVEGVRALKPEAIVLSPGPCTPDRGGHLVAVIRRSAASCRSSASAWGTSPSAQAFGGDVVRAGRVCTASLARSRHEGTGSSPGCRTPFPAGALPLAGGGPRHRARRAEVTALDATTARSWRSGTGRTRWWACSSIRRAILTPDGQDAARQLPRGAARCMKPSSSKLVDRRETSRRAEVEARLRWTISPGRGHAGADRRLPGGAADEGRDRRRRSPARPRRCAARATPVRTPPDAWCSTPAAPAATARRPSTSPPPRRFVVAGAGRHRRQARQPQRVLAVRQRGCARRAAA